MITLTSTANGIRLTRKGESYTATGPAALAVIITRFITPSTPATLPGPAMPPAPAATAPAPRRAPERQAATIAPLGQRLAVARQRYLVEV